MTSTYFAILCFFYAFYHDILGGCVTMITKRTMINAVRILTLLSLIFIIFGCSQPNKKSKSSFNSDTGKHITGWDLPSGHGSTVKSEPGGFSVCQECHGNDFSGGISSVACSSCHGGSAPHPTSWATGTYTHSSTNTGNAAVCALCHTNGANSPLNPPSPPAPAGTTPGCFNGTLCHAQAGHAAGWADPTQHGAAAKQTNGFSGCEACHGSNFAGSGSAVSCVSTAGCHSATIASPHPVAPWRGGTYTHTTTDPSNAPVCGLCHLGGRTPPSFVTLPTGTTPGCFDNTLCHATPGHAAGWADPTQHGAAAKTGNGFSSCESCHGTNLTGSGSAVSCLNTAGCHGAGVYSPHPAAPWRGGTYTHTTTDELNAPVCAQCHTTGQAGTPGCFNNTLCHATAGTCVSCHGSSQNGRRVVTGLSGDFVKTDHHVTNGTTTEIVNVAACIICHGDLVTDLGHPGGTLPAAPNVQLMDPKTGVGYASNNAAGVEKVCSSCHDGTGATRLGGSALTPFSVASDNTNPPNIGWTAAQQAHSVNGSYGGCLACHGDSATGKANAHGSASTLLMKYPYNTTVAAYTATNANNFCYNCHGTVVANGATNNIQTQFGKTSKHSSETCFDCHDQHKAKAGTHTPQANTAGGVLNGATGAQLTTNPSFWVAPTSGNFTATVIVSGSDSEATLCFKCHSASSASYNRTSPSGGFAQTDVAREFNPNNVGNYAGSWASGETAGSFHPVLAAATNNLGVTNNIVAPWTKNSLMACSDCHASDTTTDPSGPHGSAATFILKGPNTAWDATVTSVANNAWMPAGTFCLNCHANNDTNGRFPEHSRGNHRIPCFNCHVAIPHGSEHPGLLHSAAGRGAGVPAPTVINSAPYMQSTTGSRLYIVSYPTSSTSAWGQSNCGCNGTGH